MSRRELAHVRSEPSSAPPPPRDLAALESDDGSCAVLSFKLPKGAAPPPLSPAEMQIVRFVLAGLTNRCIASMRGTAPRTVANQIASIYRKLDVGSRLELVVKAPFACLYARGRRSTRQ